MSDTPGTSMTLKLANAQSPNRFRKANIRASNNSKAPSRSMLCNSNVQSVPFGHHDLLPSIGSLRSHHEATTTTRTSINCFNFPPCPSNLPPSFQRECDDDSFLGGRSKQQIIDIHFVVTLVPSFAGGVMAYNLYSGNRYVDEPKGDGRRSPYDNGACEYTAGVD